MHKRSMLSVLMGIATVLLLSSCSQVPKTLEIFTEPVEKPKLELKLLPFFNIPGTSSIATGSDTCYINLWPSFSQMAAKPNLIRPIKVDNQFQQVQNAPYE